jgi:phosphatidylglycerophosphatase C
MLPQADLKSKVKPGIVRKRLVLFDFDGTITTKDTLAEIMIFYHGRWKYRTGLLALSPVIALYLLKLIPNWEAKQRFLSWFFKGQEAKVFNKRCKQFAETVIPRLIRPKALEMIKHYKSTGAKIAVVTASAENWVGPWCAKHDLICLATKLEVKNKKITGRIEGKNCHGSEKVCRIQERFNLSDFDEIIAYGDTSGDKEMLAIAHQQHYKPFRK